jgi:hypothetical protein
MATGNFIPNFHFAQGNVYYSNSAVTFSGSAAISANAVITTSNQVIQMKNLTFTPPKGEVEVVNLLGEESTTTGASVVATGQFQNQIYDEKSWSDASLTGTLILTGHNDGTAAALPDFINLVTGTGQAISTTYHRHTFGDSTSSQIRVVAGCVFVVMKNGVEEVTLAMNIPYVNLGDIKPTGDDGHYEVDVEIKCLAKNCALEIKDIDA